MSISIPGWAEDGLPTVRPSRVWPSYSNTDLCIVSATCTKRPHSRKILVRGKRCVKLASGFPLDKPHLGMEPLFKAEVSLLARGTAPPNDGGLPHEQLQPQGEVAIRGADARPKAQLLLPVIVRVGCILCSLTLSSCSQQTVEPTIPPAPTNPPTLTRTPAITPAAESTPTATRTSTPSPTATPSLLDPSNISSLRQFEVIPLETGPLLETAFWSPDSKSIVVWTDEGWQLLDPVDLHVVESEGGESPLWYGGHERFLVLEDARQVRYSGASETLARIEPSDWYGSFNANAITVSPDGQWLAHVLGMNEIGIVSLATGETRRVGFTRNYRLEGIDGLVFNYDGAVIAIEGYAFDRPVIVVDVATGNTLYEIAGASMPSFSPDGSKLIVRGPQSLEIRNAVSGTFYQRLSSGFIVQRGGPYGTAYNIRGFSFVADGLTVAALYSTDEDGQLIIWDLATGKSERTLQGMPIDVDLFAVAPDGSQLLTYTPDARLRIWSLATGEVLAESEPYELEDSEPSLSADGTVVAIPGIPSVTTMDLSSGETREIGDYDNASRVQVTMLGGTRLAVEVMTTGWEVFLDVWDLEEGKLVKRFKDYRGCSFNTTGSHMVCQSRYVQAFEVESGRLLGSYGSPDLRYEWALSSDGSQLAICSIATDETRAARPSDNISIYETGTSEFFRLLTADEGGICSRMAFSPDGGYLVASSGYVWSLPAGTLASEFASPSPHTELMVDPSSQIILAGAQLFSLKEGSELGAIRAEGPIREASFLADGRYIAVTTDDQVELWGSSPPITVTATPSDDSTAYSSDELGPSVLVPSHWGIVPPVHVSCQQE